MKNESQKNKPAKSELEALSYEAAVAELESILKRLEKGECPLEESGQLYERGIKLASYCASILKGMEEKISKLKIEHEDQIIEESLDLS